MKLDQSTSNAFKEWSYLIVTFGTIVLNWLGVNGMMILALSVAMLFDYMTGFIRAHRFKDFTSKRSKDGITDKVILLLVPLVLALCFRAFGINIGVTIDVIFAILTLSEIYSALGNIYEIRTGQKVAEYDAITAIIGLLRKQIRAFLKSKLGDDAPKEDK